MQQDKARRKLWIIGLSIVAVWLAYEGSQECIRYYKRFNKADRVATARIVEVDPGEPAHSGTRDEDGDSGDPGRPAASYYKFDVNGTTYDGWVEDELPVGKSISIQYNSLDPSFSHAQDDHADWRGTIWHSFFLLFVVLAFLAFFVRNKKQPGTL
jgi:hypothetical protein